MECLLLGFRTPPYPNNGDLHDWTVPRATPTPTRLPLPLGRCQLRRSRCRPVVRVGAGLQGGQGGTRRGDDSVGGLEAGQAGAWRWDGVKSGGGWLRCKFLELS